MNNIDSMQGWLLRYRLTIWLIVLLEVATMAYFFVTPARVGASTHRVDPLVAALLTKDEIAALPDRPYVGQAYVTPWHYRYLPITSRERMVAVSKAGSPRSWQTTHTWPTRSNVMRWRTRILYSASDFWMNDRVDYGASGLFSIWAVDCTALYRFNGTSVWTQGSNTCGWHSFGYDIDMSLVTWNEGGANWGFMEVGVDFSVHAIWRGLPFAVGHWVRKRIYADGSHFDATRAG